MRVYLIIRTIYHIPESLTSDSLYEVDYPLKVTVELIGSVEQFSFDVLIVYDET